MKKITLFVLGQKGHAAVSACMQPEFEGIVDMVVIGKDKNLKYDYSDDIRNLCEKAGTKYCMRQNYSSASITEERIAIASGWRWMIREEFQPLIVIHDSLLPRYRGFNPLVTALLNRDEVIGATAILANEEFDRGNIIDACSTRISYPIKIADAMTEIASIVFRLTSLLLRRINNHESLDGVKQNESQASYSVWRDSDDYWIDWSRSAEDIAHFINCVSYPYAGASTLFDDGVIRIVRGTPIDDVSIANRDAGKVMFIEDDKPVVICGTGLLRIDEAFDDQGSVMLPLPRFRVRFKSGAN